MAENLFGYDNGQIIRKSIGSPAEWFVFDERSNAISIDNLSTTNAVYFSISGTSLFGTSGCGLVRADEFRSFDLRLGSISMMISGTGNAEVQIMRLS